MADLNGQKRNCPIRGKAPMINSSNFNSCYDNFYFIGTAFWQLPLITKKSKYAYKAMLVLVDEYGRGPVLISTISARANIPKKFLEVILLELRHAGYVESKKGKGGGYYLSVPPSQISLAKVFRTIEGPIAPVACVSLNFYEKCADCESELSCRFRKLMEKLRDANLGVLEANSFSDLAKINEPE